MEDFEQRFDLRVATCYGMTEVPPVIVTGWEHGPWETCGRLIDGYPWPEARVVDEHDRELPPGEVGELIVRTGAPWTLNGGYYGDPAATVAAWRNGWFHTGDAFRRDEDGWFYFIDRMKDTIRRRGENISSLEVETAVTEHAVVEACAAFGVPDTYGEHEVMIAVVSAAGAAVEPADLATWLEERLPKFMVPRYIDMVDELPRNMTSLRVQKYVLRERGVTATTWDRNA
jgi:crotonobetaine/carnitine-CoA ligase